MKSSYFLIILFVSPIVPIFAQQKANAEIKVEVKSPRYSKNTGPKVVIDGAHHNFHTYDGRFNPFARLLEADGYQVSGPTKIFSKKRLKQQDILVISNPLNEVNTGGGNWILPNPSAFSKKEIKQVKKWVKKGGSLLLINCQ